MEAVIEALVQRADVVLFDAPPVTVVTDAVILATKVDGVLLVVSAGDTKREHAKQAVDRLGKVNANIVGAVLNNASLDTSLQGYYT
jgi:non-specific protein-tyrosine kinase